MLPCLSRDKYYANIGQEAQLISHRDSIRFANECIFWYCIPLVDKNNTLLNSLCMYLLHPKPKGLHQSFWWIQEHEEHCRVPPQGLFCMFMDPGSVNEKSNKKHYKFQNDMIWVFYDHSIEQYLHKNSVKPPDILYHGTVKRVVKSIFVEDLEPMRQLYVHLVADFDTGLQVASKYKGKSVIHSYCCKYHYRWDCLLPRKWDNIAGRYSTTSPYYYALSDWIIWQKALL